MLGPQLMFTGLMYINCSIIAVLLDETIEQSDNILQPNCDLQGGCIYSCRQSRFGMARVGQAWTSGCLLSLYADKQLGEYKQRSPAQKSFAGKELHHMWHQCYWLLLCDILVTDCIFCLDSVVLDALTYRGASQGLMLRIEVQALGQLIWLVDHLETYPDFSS
jgi:hypothetical protein